VEQVRFHDTRAGEGSLSRLTFQSKTLECAAMKYLTLFFLVALIALAAWNYRLERQIKYLSQREQVFTDAITHLETTQYDQRDRAKADKEAKHALMLTCISGAETKFNQAVQKFGTRNRDGSYSVPVPTGEAAARQKESELQECKLLYGEP
jgi:hypothetical protein